VQGAASLTMGQNCVKIQVSLWEESINILVVQSPFSFPYVSTTIFQKRFPKFSLQGVSILIIIEYLLTWPQNVYIDHQFLSCFFFLCCMNTSDATRCVGAHILLVSL
jgi:hypothetical protein